MRRIRLVKAIGRAAVAAMVLGSVPVHACADIGEALIHRDAPVYAPPGVIVAEVEIFGDDEQALYRQGIPARVRRLVSGQLTDEWIILRWLESSCSNPFRNGRTGIIVGVERDRRIGVPRLEPFPAQRTWDDRLPPKVLAEEWFRNWLSAPTSWWSSN